MLHFLTRLSHPPTRPWAPAEEPLVPWRPSIFLPVDAMRKRPASSHREIADRHRLNLNDEADQFAPDRPLTRILYPPGPGHRSPHPSTAVLTSQMRPRPLQPGAVAFCFLKESLIPMKPTAIYTATISGKSTLLDETLTVLRELAACRRDRGLRQESPLRWLTKSPVRRLRTRKRISSAVSFPRKRESRHSRWTTAGHPPPRV